MKKFGEKRKKEERGNTACTEFDPHNRSTRLRIYPRKPVRLHQRAPAHRKTLRSQQAYSMDVEVQAPAAAAGGVAPDADLFSAAVTAAIHGWDPLVVRTRVRCRH